MNSFLVYHITRNLYLCATHEVDAKRSPIFFPICPSLNFESMPGSNRKGIIAYRAPEFFSVVRIGSPHPLPRKRVCLTSREPKWRGVDTLACGVVRGPNSDDWTEKLALCILCGSNPGY